MFGRKRAANFAAGCIAIASNFSDVCNNMVILLNIVSVSAIIYQEILAYLKNVYESI